jgi:hypothetical protein
MSSERDAVVATFEATSKAWADGDASAFAAWYALFPGEDEAPAERRDLATWVLTRRDFQWFVEAYHSCPAS